jgi:hypothetical protein
MPCVCYADAATTVVGHRHTLRGLLGADFWWPQFYFIALQYIAVVLLSDLDMLSSAAGSLVGSKLKQDLLHLTAHRRSVRKAKAKLESPLGCPEKL